MAGLFLNMAGSVPWGYLRLPEMHSCTPTHYGFLILCFQLTHFAVVQSPPPISHFTYSDEDCGDPATNEGLKSHSICSPQRQEQFSQSQAQFF